ncbi:MAG: zinc-dependent alcohol dehydrogenase family protein [Halobacteriaceae archaeon]
MRAAVLTDVGEVELRDRRRPEAGPGEVVVDVGACGVCMTDYHIFHGSFPADPPVVLGHESAGEVVEAGDGVRNVEVGETVALNPIVPCGTCSYCREGRENLCRDSTVVGGAGDTILDGAFAEYVRVPAASVEPVGDLAVERAAFAEPLACCVHGVERTDVGVGDTVALVGAGPIGLLLLQAFRNRGAGDVVVSELVPERRELALELGADHVVDPAEGDPAEAVRDAVGRVDVAAEVVGAEPTIEQAREMTAPGGQTLVFGVPPRDATVEVNPFDVYYRELDLVGTYALTPAAFSEALALLRGGRVEVDPLVTEELGLDELEVAFDRMERSEGLKKLVRP